MNNKGRKYNFLTRTRTKNISIHPKYGNMKKIAVLLLGFLIASSLSGCTGKEKNPVAVIKTNMGTMKVELYEDKMPTTTKNFVKLANDGFYNGLVFHRVIKNFMIQGGGFYPNGTYKESPYGPIPLETNPDVTHVDGAISMARTSDPNSATSQFFICDGAQHYLDGQYAAFGKVIEGMEVVRAIASVETTTKHGMQDWPVDEVIIEHAAVLT